jgi:hypothetical protein
MQGQNALVQLGETTQADPKAKPGYIQQCYFLFYKGCLVIPQNYPLIPTSLLEFSFQVGICCEPEIPQLR